MSTRRSTGGGRGGGGVSTMSTAASSASGTLATVDSAAAGNAPRIRVHDASLFADVVTAGEVYLSSEEPAPTLSKTAEEIQADHFRHKQEQKEIEFQREFERAKRERERRIHDALRRRDEEGERLLETLKFEQESFVQQVEQFVKLDEHSRQVKREQLYAEWSEKVFNPIQESIQGALERVSAKTIERRRREMFDKFLEQTNVKQGLFRDIIIAAEYNPMEAHRHTIKYSTATLDDPVKKSLTRVQKERANVGLEPGDSDSSGKTLGRETFDVTQWGIVESTPHGHYSKLAARTAKMMESGRTPPPQPPAARTAVKLDHYNVDRSRETWRQENPSGKRTFPDRM